MKNNNVFTVLGASNHVEDNREEDDFYTTQEKTVISLLKKLKEINIDISQNVLIEPAVGCGNIINAIQKDKKNYIAFDIKDRGFPNTIVKDFLTVEELNLDNKTIITNPPYKLAQEFVVHSMNLLSDNEYCLMLLKIQFLEGKARKELFKKYPPKFVWVFSERQKCLKNDKDSKGSSAICYAWYIWQKGFVGKPTIDWI